MIAGPSRTVGSLPVWLGVTAMLVAAASAAAEVAMLPQPSDLRQEAGVVRSSGQPLVVLFSIPGCVYCPGIRNNYLAPLAAATQRPVPVVRELDMTSAKPIHGFNGEATTPAQVARQYRVRVSPTVLMLGPKGEVLAEPLIGSDTAGFYGAYLDRALETARKALQANRQFGGKQAPDDGRQSGQQFRADGRTAG